MSLSGEPEHTDRMGSGVVSNHWDYDRAICDDIRLSQAYHADECVGREVEGQSGWGTRPVEQRDQGFKPVMKWFRQFPCLNRRKRNRPVAHDRRAASDEKLSEEFDAYTEELANTTQILMQKKK
jgi:hypothetical protein